MGWWVGMWLIEDTEAAASVERLIQASTEGLELEILGLQNDLVRKSCAIHENFWDLVD
jgi:hypothetical protein